MLFDAQLFTTGTLLSSGLLFAFAMWRALAGAPWWQLYQPGRLHLFLASVLGIAVLWSLSAGISPGLSLHYLGVTTLTLMFGWQFTLLAVALALVLVALFTAQDWASLPLAFLLSGLVPVLVSHGLLRLVERLLPPHPFIYLYVCAFAGAALAILASMLAVGGLLSFLGIYDLEKITGEYLIYLPLLVLPEAILNGTLVTAMVMLKPEWLCTWSDERYIRGR
ncbi:energy-coupling factor ABC transporter permease [Thioalkalivibrio sulfidiphilus]|uniref:energy-coupling factor ABC transporter permease n=1 Tax=Thioalkalivibrio sulfidiphilus TaxID=1033854 RepID=UPI00047796B1|nr:energy-coupling factor ABC transporter permease [Thioalkalivibrio sulfidiphilus]